MSSTSTIEWTDATWNPVRGCTKVSPGCKHCYAETFANRFRGVARHAYKQGFVLKLVPGMLAVPLKWVKPKTIFVNSMSDLFQVGVPDTYVEQVVRVMQMANWHTYQVLTKRADRMRDMLAGPLAFAAHDQHIWWGVSVEDKEYGLPRLEALRKTPAGKRFLSVEPLLEDLGQIELGGIDWVIVGGESGPGARPMEKEWVLNVQRQCRAAEVKFFFKQWGGVQKKKAGRLLNGRTYDDMPPRTYVPVLPPRERKALMRVVAGWSSNSDQRTVSQPPTRVDSSDELAVLS